MRISTNLQYQQLAAQMSKASSDLAQMQGKVASGLKFNTPSQAPELVGRSVALQSRIAGFKADVATLGQVRLGIDSQAVALEAAQPLLSRLKELSLQGASQQFTQTERDAMAAEAKSLRLGLLDLANSRDPDGRYVFGGTESSRPPYELDGNGQITYVGGSTPLRVRVGDSAYEDATVVGPSSWQGVMRPTGPGDSPERVDLFAAVGDLETALRSNDRAALTRAVDELSLVGNSLQVGMAKLGASQNRLTVVQGQAEELAQRATDALSGVRDLDYATALTELKKQETLLQASQSLLSRMSQLTLLDYMR